MAGCPVIRRVIAWALLGLYGVVASGLPLPLGMPSGPGIATRRGDRVAATRLAAKDRSRPFPCMDKPCGCATAEQCFTACCCHTPAERLAWARAHGLEPAVLASLAARVARRDAAGATSATPQEGCCATAAAPSRPSCCAASAAVTDAAEEVCRDYQSLAADHADADRAAERGAAAGREHHEEPQPRVASLRIVLRALLACGGLAAEWFALGGGGLPPPRVEFVPGAGRDEPLVAADETPFRLAAPPAAPPPRAA